MRNSMSKEYLNIILVDNNVEILESFRRAFEELKIETKLNTYRSEQELMQYLYSDHRVIPEILFLGMHGTNGNMLDCIDSLKTDARFDGMTTAVYASYLPENEVEDIFVKGANIYIKKPCDFDAFKKVLADVITMNWQYHTSGLNKDNFIMRV